MSQLLITQHTAHQSTAIFLGTITEKSQQPLKIAAQSDQESVHLSQKDSDLCLMRKLAQYQMKCHFQTHKQTAMKVVNEYGILSLTIYTTELIIKPEKMVVKYQLLEDEQVIDNFSFEFKIIE